MKIAFLTPEYPHPKMGKAGGIGSSLIHLSEGLVALGHEVVVLVYGQDKDENFKENGISFYKIKNRILKGFSWQLTSKKIEHLIDTLYDQQIIDVVEAPDWTGITSGIHPRDCPVILRLHGSDTYFCHLDNRPVKKHNFKREQKAFMQANGIISVSAFTAQLTNTLFNAKREIEIIPNGIDLSSFQPTDTTESPATIFYFGTLISKKGALELPLIFNKVVAQYPEANLLLAGSDSNDNKTGSNSTWALMQSLFSALALDKVSYIGKIPYDAMQEHIATATVCVFPTFAEALPVSWIESMAMEKAIVASNIGWAPELIDDGKNGFLVHPTDHKVYADKVIRLLNDKKLRTTFGNLARKKVLSNFDNKVVAKQSVAFYKQFVLKNRL